MTPQLSVVIAARNEAEHIGRCLSALATQLEGLEVIVVDDGSTDGTADVALAALPQTRVIRIAHGGAGAARNAGVAEARAPRIAFLDADATVLSGWAKAAGRAGPANEVRMGRVVTPPTVPARLVTLSCFGEFCGAKPRTVQGFATLNVVGPAALFRANPFPVHGGEDRVLSWRMHRAGVAIHYDPALRVEHAPPTNVRALLHRQAAYARRGRSVRLLEPSLSGARIARLPAPLGAPLLAGARLARDLGRLREAADGLGISRASQPLYALGLCAWRLLDLLVLTVGTRKA